MKALQLEYPVDEHLKPVKDSDSISTSMEISTTKLRVNDFEVSGTMTGNVDFGDNDITNIDSLNADKFSISASTEMTNIFDEDDMSHDSEVALSTQQSIKAYTDAVPLGCYSKTLIKVMPHEFMINDDFSSGRAGNIIEDDTSNTLGYRMSNSATEGYAFVKIPSGYKATHVQVLASASTSNAVTCKTFNYTTGATTDLETFDFNTNSDITDVTATTTNDLVIKILPASTSTIIYGATITIASV